MNDELEEMLKRGRRVYRATQGEAGGPDAPAGFAARLLRNRTGEKPSPLAIWERVSYVGTACALAIAMVMSWQVKGGDRGALAADPWMDMPMGTEESRGGPR